MTQSREGVRMYAPRHARRPPVCRTSREAAAPAGVRRRRAPRAPRAAPPPCASAGGCAEAGQSQPGGARGALQRLRAAGSRGEAARWMLEEWGGGATHARPGAALPCAAGARTQAAAIAT